MPNNGGLTVTELISLKKIRLIQNVNIGRRGKERSGMQMDDASTRIPLYSVMAPCNAKIITKSPRKETWPL
jgi:hypothetical protein